MIRANRGQSPVTGASQSSPADGPGTVPGVNA